MEDFIAGWWEYYNYGYVDVDNRLRTDEIGRELAVSEEFCTGFRAAEKSVGIGGMISTSKREARAHAIAAYTKETNVQ